MKTRQITTRRISSLLFSTFMIAVLAATTLKVVAATGDVISAQLGILGGVTSDDLGGVVTNQPLGATELTGAFPATNWNPLAVALPGNGAGWTEQSFALKDQTGVGSGVHLIVRGANDARWLRNPPPDSAPITKMFNTYITGWYPPNASTPTELGQGTMELVLTDLVNSQSYNLYVYLADDLGLGAAVDAGTGVTNYTGALSSTVNQASHFVASVNQDPNGTRDPGNYVHLTGITPVNGAITVTVNYDDPTWTTWGVGVCGLQLVKASVDLVAPSIVRQPVSRTVYPNVAATFSVEVLGTPTPSVQWYEVVGGNANAVTGATSLSYTTPPATLGMTGTKYLAVASNTVSTAASSPATLTVVAPTADAGAVLSAQLGILGGVNSDDLGGVVTSQPLGATELTGAFPATNWNPLTIALPGNGAGWTEQSFTLNDRKGIGSAVHLIVRGANDARYLSQPPPDSAPITKLLNTYITGWFPPSASTPNELGQGTMELVLTNLDNSQTYNLYVYLADDLGKGAAVDAGTGVTNYTGPLSSTVNHTSYFIASVNQDPNGTRDPGNYVHLTGITPMSSAIMVAVNYDDPTWTTWGVGVCGLQLVKASVDQVAPLITSQPASQRVITNTTATLSVGVLGTPTPSVQWYQVVGAATNLIAGATGLSYTTAPVTDATSGRGYFVVLTSGLGSVTSQVAFVTAGHMVSPAPGWLQLDQYNGATLNDLLDPGYLAAQAPDRVRWVSSFEGPADLPDDSGERFFGWFIPPVTTNYVFFVCSDDASLLLLSTDATAARKCQIAEETGWSAARSWVSSGGNSILSQKRSDQFVYNGSFPGGVWPGGNTITLTAGVPYYIELAHFEGNGGQNASVTFTFAGAADPADGTATVLTSDKLSTMSAPDYLLPQPQPRIVTVTVSGSNVSLSGTNGLVNALYYALASTNISLPLASWTPAQTNRFDAVGSFADTIPLNLTEPSRFYRLSVP